MFIKFLRLHHEKELLVPARVEEFSGYRYYENRNVETARVIKILKNFDFSLAEIKDILDERSDESDLLGFLENKLKRVQDKVHHYEAVSRSIQLIIQNGSVKSFMKKREGTM